MALLTSGNLAHNSFIRYHLQQGLNVHYESQLFFFPLWVQFVFFFLPPSDPRRHSNHKVSLRGTKLLVVL